MAVTTILGLPCVALTPVWIPSPAQNMARSEMAGTLVIGNPPIGVSMAGGDKHTHRQPIEMCEQTSGGPPSHSNSILLCLPSINASSVTARSDLWQGKRLTHGSQIGRCSGGSGVELAFIDPGVSAFPALLQTLRPEVVPILLTRTLPVARQIAIELARRSRLDAIHVVAHGEPGRVSFTAGHWSSATLASDAKDLAAIGRALRPGAGLSLWSCRTGVGTIGGTFIAGLAEATGATVAAADGLVGAAARGGKWELAGSGASARPPLTPAGIAAYDGLLLTTSYIGGSGNWSDPTKWDNGVPAAGDDAVLVGGGKTITLDVDTASLNSLTFNTASNITFNIGTFTLNVGGTSADSISTADSTGNEKITISGGTINDAGGLDVAHINDIVTGFGVLNIAGTISGAGQLIPSGGALDVLGVFNPGPVPFHL